MELFEQTPSRSGSRFGKLSTNMFFTRNTAKPKRVRHLEGLNGALICNVNDDPSVVRSTPASSLGFNRTNLPAFETPRRVERLVPPTGFWNTYGVIQDTDRWRQELAFLATASGLGIEKDEQRHLHRSTTTADQQHASRSGAHYSTQTGRFNEGTAKSRGRTGSKHGTAHSDTLFNVPENEREMWMLQVLCQLLGTSNLEDVQSWLISASQTEKEQARTMINSALQGLKESDRTSNSTQQSVDLNSLSNFVEKQKNEEKQVSQKYLKDSLHRPSTVLQSIHEEQPNDNNLSDSWANLLSNNNSKLPSENLTTYQRAYQNHNPRSYSSFDVTSSNNKNNFVNDNDENQQEDENDEQIDTIKLDEDRRQPRSASLTKIKKQTKNPQSPLVRSSSSHQQKHRVESLQINDDDDDDDDNDNNSIENENKDQQQRNETIFPLIKMKESTNQDNIGKSRKIRELETKLSRQEDDAKKQLNELQSKQSRLENALKLLVKQTSSYGKRRQPTHDNVENGDAPIVNVIIRSPKENDHRHRDKQQQQQEINSSGKQSKLSTMKKNRDKIGDYTLENVKVQISLSRLDNRPTKSYSGIWKPDASTLHRLQGN